MAGKQITLEWNPLFLKELRVMLRDRKQGSRGWWGILLVSLPALALLAVQVAFPGPVTRIGRYVVLGFGVLQNILALGAVALAATGIVSEREKNTYEVLQASPIPPERIFFGKMLFAFYTVAVRQTMVLVPMSIVWLSGGFPFHVLLLYLPVLFATDLFVAALGLFISAGPHRLPKIGFSALRQSASRTQVALQKAMGISAVFLILLPFYAVLIPTITGAAGAGSGMSGRTTPLDILPDLSLLGTICPAVTLAFWGDVEVFGAAVPLWVVSVVCNLLLAAMFFFFGVGVLRGRDRDASIGGRACLAAFLLLLFAVMVGGVGQRPVAGPFVVACAFGLVSLVVLVPCLSMGAATRAEQTGFLAEAARNSLSPRRLLLPRVSGAAAFILALQLALAPLLWLSLHHETFPCVTTVVVCSFCLALAGNRGARTPRDGPPNRGGFAAAVLLLFLFATIVPLLLHAASQTASDPALIVACVRARDLLLPLSPVGAVFLRLATTVGRDAAELEPIRTAVGGYASWAWVASCGWFALVGLLAVAWPVRKRVKAAAPAQPAGTARA